MSRTSNIEYFQHVLITHLWALI